MANEESKCLLKTPNAK